LEIAKHRLRASVPSAAVPQPEAGVLARGGVSAVARTQIKVQT
jgi:hypothetical protein